MARPNNVVMDTKNYYGGGYNASNGYNNKLFYYDAASIKAATSERIFGQLASTRTMPQGSGREYRVKVDHYSYERMPWAVNTTGPVDATTLAFSEEFKKKGYVSARSLSSVEQSLLGNLTTYPKFAGKNSTAWYDKNDANISLKVTDNTGITSEGFDLNGTTSTANADIGKRLFEGQGPSNKVTLVSTTINTFIHRFGEMIDYTEDVLLFSEDNMQLKYHKDLGERQRDIVEDLDQLTLLATPNVMFSGTATSLATMGTGIGTGAVDATTGLNAVEESFKVNYKLLQAAVKRLSRYKVPKKTSMVTGSLKVDTKTIPACYVAICGDDVKVDIQNLVRTNGKLQDFAFVGVEQYAAGDKAVFDGEFGKVGEVRFICSQKMLVARNAGALVDENYVGSLSYTGAVKTGKFDVFPILFVGGDSFANIKLQGKGVAEFFSQPPTSTKSDPYAMKGYFAYKLWYGSIILRPERVLRLNVLASA